MAAPVGAGCMFYQIDWARLLGVLLLLGAGSFIATHFAGAGQTRSTSPALMPTNREALRGMWIMTLLGFGSGLAGALLENALGHSWLVQCLHSIYCLCWALPFLINSLEQQFAVTDLSLRFFSEVFGLLGVLLVPVLWFAVFLGVARVPGWLGGLRFRSCSEACKCDVCSKPTLTAESACNKPAASVPKRRDATS